MWLWKLWLRKVCDFLLLQQLFRSVYEQWHHYRIWLKAFNVMLLAVWEIPVAALMH